MSFTKLDSGIIYSSLWSAPLHARVLWITILAMCDKDGFVSSSSSGLHRASNLKKEEFEEAIKILEGPDSDSRTSTNEGRRIIRVDGGWIVVNYAKYREHSETTREKNRERIKRFREKIKCNANVTPCNVTVTPCNVTVTDVTLPSVSVSASASASASEEEEKRGCKGGKEGETTQQHNTPTENGIKSSAERLQYPCLSAKEDAVSASAMVLPTVTINAQKTARFVRPCIDEIQEYINERVALGQPRIDAQQFFDYYESNGWRVGKNSMKDWRAAVRTWERNVCSSKNNKTQKRYGRNELTRDDVRDIMEVRLE